MESLNSNSQERAASVATNARQSKGKLHGIFSTTSFTSPGSMLLNLDQLEKQLDKEQFQETGSMDAFRMQSKEGKVYSSKALDASLVVTECSGTKSDKQDTNSSSGNYLTHVVDANIRLVNDQNLYRVDGGEFMVCPIVNAPAGRLLGAYDLGVATPRAVVHAGDKTSGDARSWYMISEDAKSWVLIGEENDR
ncbi:hypothetical protein Tco_0660947 [Tanacetum coccineum]